MPGADRLPDPLAVALDVGQRLQQLGVRYLVGGSLASSVHGEPRSTLDVDIVADLRPSQVRGFTDAMRSSYYLDEGVVAEAVESGGSFNAIHLAAAIKVDFFVVGSDPFEAERLEQRLSIPVGPGAEGILWIDTPEHTVLRKLEWYRRGGEVSERQWRDARGIVSLQGSRLDRARLERWAAVLGVTDLLHRVLTE